MSNLKFPRFTSDQRHLFSRVVWFWVLCVFIWRIISNTMISQLESPIVIYPYHDLLFWFFHLLHIPETLTSIYGLALGFDVMLVGSVVAALLFPKNYWFPRLYSFLILFYFITIITYSNHHLRPMIGLLFVGLPFCFSSLKWFSNMFYLIRFYVVFIYVSAGLYKLFRGSMFYKDQMIAIIEQTQLDFLLNEPGHWHAKLFSWVLDHPSVGIFLFVSATVLELLFIVGFFTFKWDKFLFATAMLLHVGFYFTMRFFAFELIVLDLTFLPWNKWSHRLGNISITTSQRS